MSRHSSLREFRRDWKEEIKRHITGGGPLRRRGQQGRRTEEYRRQEKGHVEPVREWNSLPVASVRGPSSTGSASSASTSRSLRGAPAVSSRAVYRRRPQRPRPGYLELAESLLEGSRNISRTEAPKDPVPEIRTNRGVGLVEQLISDLNEINEVPFFDIQLPYELALQIFQNLGRKELGRCAQVSKTWKVLAEDEVLWYRVCQQEGFLPDAKISDCACWKHALRDSLAKENTLRANWKNRIGAVNQLQYELGKVLCDVHSSDGVVIAGYTSGDVRLWDTRTWDYTAPILEPTRDTAEPGQQPHVSFVRINSSLAAAAYEDGTIDVWSLMIGREPVHHYQHNQKIQALALNTEGVAIATASGFQIKVESPDDRGYWQTSAQFTIQKLVNFLHLVPDTGGIPVNVAAAGEEVYLLRSGQPNQVLHSVYGHPVTCLDVSPTMAVFGVKSYGWMMNEGNKILVYSLQTGQRLITLGNSAGDFTCINMKDSPPNMLVTGNKDRRVRVYDIRTNSSLCSLYAHQLGVTAARMDDWKIVSGGEEGLVCVWDQRMGTKLWETHARHPVRHIWFNAHSLITANIPVEKSPRGACITDDDLTAHRRHRGIIYSYQFSVDHLARESILPICRSSYDEAIGYNYNIGLAVPYDNV